MSLSSLLISAIFDLFPCKYVSDEFLLSLMSLFLYNFRFMFEFTVPCCVFRCISLQLLNLLSLLSFLFFPFRISIETTVQYKSFPIIVAEGTFQNDLASIVEKHQWLEGAFSTKIFWFYKIFQTKRFYVFRCCIDCTRINAKVGGLSSMLTMDTNQHRL